MELKDKIKQLRKEKGMTQAQLAEALFVSRSTVAKWENGLGLPGPDSMQALEALFEVEPQQIATSEPESVIVKKNRKLHLIGQLIGWVLFLTLTGFSIYLPFALHEGNYGFSWDMTAGVFADNDYIEAGNYRIYYTVFEGDWEDGRHWSDLSTFKVVKKQILGYSVQAEIYDSGRIVTKDNYVVGRLYSFKGTSGYYHILQKAKHYKVEQVGDPLLWDIPAELICATQITIDGEIHQLQHGFFFTTAEPVNYFRINGNWYDVLN